MRGDITTESRDALIKALETELDTRDKRYMFLRMEFKDLVSRINLEGSAHEAAWNIYEEFRKQCMLGSLMACMNFKLDTDLYLILKKNNMSTGWDGWNPAPIEFLHGKMMEAFHRIRKSKGDSLSMEMNGTDFNNLIAESKMLTYEEYPSERLARRKPRPLSELPNDPETYNEIARLLGWDVKEGEPFSVTYHEPRPEFMIDDEKGNVILDRGYARFIIQNSGVIGLYNDDMNQFKHINNGWQIIQTLINKGYTLQS